MVLVCQIYLKSQTPELCQFHLWREHILMRPQVCIVSRRIGTQSSGSLAVPVTFWPVFLAVAGLAVNLRLVRCHRGAVQPFPAAH